MLLATAWGSKHGGVSSFNMDFACGLAAFVGDRGKVFSAAFRPTIEEIQSAGSKDVHLVAIDRPVDSAAYDRTWVHEVLIKFREENPSEKIDWWVGHDVITGEAAVQGPSAAGYGRSALIMHMSYVDYQGYKSGVSQ